uniref:Uncharacterized protein n=1 Tax=Daphnia galeata TaxID=27404 RepID=A0A8J2S7M0_9CRUS|nr:unnamed protein product [Daphnia galeata]
MFEKFAVSYFSFSPHVKSVVVSVVVSFLLSASEITAIDNWIAGSSPGYLGVGLLAAALVISWRFDLCQVKPMCFYARKSPIQFGFMPWSFIFKYEVQSSPVKSSQVKPMCFYMQESQLVDLQP